ncbi:class E sortase [Streptomyces sp. NPDC053493]|uniref:class E sortase n=1 Tax=Streptomyces sp. NPDC053493 TaxID=3365705 RepID=UPI0037D7D1DB
MTSGSPWFRAASLPEGEPEHEPRPPQPRDEAETAVYEPIPGPGGYEPAQPAPAPYEPAQPAPAPYEPAQPSPAPYEPAQPSPTPYEPAQPSPTPYEAYQAPYDPAAYAPAPGPAPEAASAYGPAYGETYDSYEAGPTVASPVAGPDAGPGGPPGAGPVTVPDDETMALRSVEESPAASGTTPLPGPGRAERRRAARRKGRGTAPEPAAPPSPAAPLSRVEARRAARAAKDSVGVVLSRVVGELFITFGVVMLLFVTYQLWWTNVRAGQETDKAKEEIENSWTHEDSAPEAFEPGKGFAIMYIPKLDVVVPVAEGISKTKVLDKGMVGHYGEGKLKTAMPSDKQGNFAVAGHRNTHGEPFRYINRLQPGDPIVVETGDAYYTYEMTSILPQTSPSNVSVIDPVPKASGFTGPGRYITLTTCTPEFTSTYRMIVWGKLVEERPRSKGKPEALVG